MARIPDRKKMRREYLKRKGKAYTKVAAKGLFVIPAALVSLGIIAAQWWGISQGYPFLPISILLFMLSAMITQRLWRAMQQARQDAAHLPYVPPVTTDTLPAEE